ncbi:hypothetical protein E4U57_003223 [Claviceps arundinis]|uniref:Uncharacterized protein n=1 Tax=Claviceps arundinis TaxID=1623583 RepID=A0A9P7SPW3_9HYPO|nr:hypothetical protein E4U57_003223 [Claviceps arundinis]KAG5971495.1 hypothetical protein E4U56_006763 [Claviceps arundinis]
MLHDINNSQPPPNDAYPVTAKPPGQLQAASPSVSIRLHLCFAANTSGIGLGLPGLQEPQVSQQHGLAWMGFETLILSQTNAPVTLMASQALSIRPAETHTPAGLSTDSTPTPRPRQHLNHAIHMIPTLSQTTPPSACRPKKHRTSSHQEEEETTTKRASKKDQGGTTRRTTFNQTPTISYRQLPPAQAAKAAPLARLEC